MSRKTATWGIPSPTPRQRDILVALTPQRLRQLLQLVHPDRHAGSELSKEIFQWLNSKKIDNQK